VNVLGLLALLMLASKKAEPAAAAAPKPAVSAQAGVRVIGQVLSIPLRDGTNCIVAKIQTATSTDAIDAIVIARGTVYGSRKGEAVVLRCGSESDAKAIADEIRGKF
jgi:hypothetical protein